MTTAARRPQTRDKVVHGLPRVAYTAREVASMLGIAYGTALQLINEGELEHVRAGRHKLVPVSAFEEFMARTKRGDDD